MKKTTQKQLLYGLAALVLAAGSTFALSSAQAQSGAVFVQPSVGAPNGNPSLYIDTGNIVSLSQGKLNVNTASNPITAPAGLSDRDTAQGYNDFTVGSWGGFVQSFADVFESSLGIRDKVWVDSDSLSSPQFSALISSNETAVNIAKFGTTPNPITHTNPSTGENIQPRLVHQYVAHGQVGVEEKLCADAFGYVQVCSTGGTASHDSYLCGGNMYPPNGAWTGPSSAGVGGSICASGVTYASTDGSAIDCDVVYPNAAAPSGTECINARCNVAAGAGLTMGATCETESANLGG